MTKTLVVTACFKQQVSTKNESNMLNIKCDMLIFCDTESYFFIEEIRSYVPNLTKIVRMDFQQFYCYRYLELFKNQVSMDAEKNNEFLYMICNEKPNFLKIAIENFPDYLHFLWINVDCFRFKTIDFINNLKMTDKILLLEVDKFLSFNYQFINTISGSIFGGSKQNVLIWWEKYYEMLEYFIEKEWFIGKDSSIINNVYLKNKHLCELVDLPIR